MQVVDKSVARAVAVDVLAEGQIANMDTRNMIAVLDNMLLAHGLEFMMESDNNIGHLSIVSKKRTRRSFKRRKRGELLD